MKLKILGRITIICLMLLGCKKHATYKVEVVLLDYYTNAKITFQPTVMSKCEQGIIGFGSCQPFATKLSDNNGLTTFSEEIDFGSLDSYGFYTEVANGYMGTEIKKINNQEKDTLKLKPLAEMNFELSISTQVDSLRLTIYCFDFISDNQLFQSTGNLMTKLLVTPDEDNNLRIQGYFGGKVLDDKFVGFMPNYGQVDSLKLIYP